MSQSRKPKNNSSQSGLGGLIRGQRFEATVESLADGGAGIVRMDGIPVFVSRVAAGDVVEVEVYDARKGFGFGHALEVLEASPERQDEPCKLAKVCGGCQWQHITYDGQLTAKRDLVRQALKHIGGIDCGLDAELVSPTLAAADPWNYRNKVQYPVGSPKNSDRILAGYYKEGSHELVNIKHCPVQPEPFDRMLAAVKSALEAQRWPTYDELAGTKHAIHKVNEMGAVRHIIGRYSSDSGDALMTIVVNAAPSDYKAFSVEMLDVAENVMEAVPDIKGVCVNFNTLKANRIIGPVTEVVKGADHIVETLRSTLPQAPKSLRQGITFRISPVSFFQVNSAQAAVLLDEVLRGSGLLDTGSGSALVIDAYAGVGTIASWLSASVGKVIAIEDVEEAVVDGRINLQANGIENVEFRQGRVEQVAPDLVLQGLKPDVVVVDPPRKGVDPSALASLIALEARTFVYVSCNPSTLARDLKILAASGYKLKGVQPIDMFPQTFHVESVSVLERQSPA